MSALDEIADAVVAELNAGTWSQSFDAERVRVAELELRDIDTVRVLVRPVSWTPQQVTRGKSIKNCTIEVAVLVRLPDATVAQADPWVTLLEELVEHFDGLRPDTIPEAYVETSAPDPVYDERHLAERSQFTAVMRLEVADWR